MKHVSAGVALGASLFIFAGSNALAACHSWGVPPAIVEACENGGQSGVLRATIGGIEVARADAQWVSGYYWEAIVYFPNAGEPMALGVRAQFYTGQTDSNGNPHPAGTGNWALRVYDHSKSSFSQICSSPLITGLANESCYTEGSWHRW